MNPNLDLSSLTINKRVLIVADECGDSEERSECLRDRGFRVDCAVGGDAAVRMSRSVAYDLIVLAMDSAFSVCDLATELQTVRKDVMITCLADCWETIPPLPCDRLLWTSEPLEYFAARVEALAAAA
jgi:PleD family two-component response regulator